MFIVVRRCTEVAQERWWAFKVVVDQTPVEVEFEDFEGNDSIN
jgi:hypothetical protein